MMLLVFDPALPSLGSAVYDIDEDEFDTFVQMKTSEGFRILPYAEDVA